MVFTEVKLVLKKSKEPFSIHRGQRTESAETRRTSAPGESRDPNRDTWGGLNPKEAVRTASDSQMSS